MSNNINNYGWKNEKAAASCKNITPLIIKYISDNNFPNQSIAGIDNDIKGIEIVKK